MPCDVAMHKPGTRVVSLKGHDEVTGFREHDSVATRGVGEAQLDAVAVGACTLGNDPEIMSVKMDRMGNVLGGLDDEVNPLAVGWKLNNVVVGGPVTCVLHDLEKSWILPLRVVSK